jgi:hypothetical protein
MNFVLFCRLCLGLGLILEIEDKSLQGPKNNNKDCIMIFLILKKSFSSKLREINDNR